MAKFGLAALAVVAALVLSFGVRSSTPTAHADIDGTTAIWCGFVAALDVDGDDAPTPAGADFVAACDGLSAAEIVNISEAATAADADDPDGVGDEDGVLEPGELDDLDLDANQITDGGATFRNTILLIAFVDNDGLVTFDSDTNGTVVVVDDGVAAETTPADDTNDETCEGDDDNDCGDEVPDNGDGVVNAVLTEAGDAGEDIEVDIEQDGDEVTETVTIVGPADAVELTFIETTIQSGADEDCSDGTLEVTDTDALTNPDSTIARVIVTDDDGTALTRESVTLTSDDDDIATIGDNTAVTVDGGDSGIAYFSVVCGQDETGDVVFEAVTGDEDDEATITVVGEAANVTLTAAPAQIACDGTQTSTVTATVTDSEGNNVANGTPVQFSVVALGTANPINTTTTDGQASSTITPLSGATAGVTVIVSSGDAQASTRVDCSLPVPTPTTPGVVATPTRPGGISGPDTGNGGYLGQDSSAGFPLWTLVALGLGSFALVAGGMVTRRAGR